MIWCGAPEHLGGKREQESVAKRHHTRKAGKFHLLRCTGPTPKSPAVLTNVIRSVKPVRVFERLVFGPATMGCLALAAVQVSYATGASGYPGGDQDPYHGKSIGSVYGTVFDSLRSEPLADALVVIWNTEHRTRTDGFGRYWLAGVEPGTYQVTFFHRRLAEMGISSVPHRATVADDSVRVDLGIPSALTVALAMCAAQERRAGTGVVVGRVSDASTGVALPDARVELSWDADGSPESLTLHTDGDGRYTACEVPAGRKVWAGATFLDRVARIRWVEVAELAGVQADIALTQLEPSTMRGTVTDAAAGHPVADVMVWLGGTTSRVLTDSQGSFSLESVVPGEHELLTEHLAYARRSDELTVPEGSMMNVHISIDQRPIELPGIQVEIEAISVSERATGGIHITRSEIERVRHLSRDIGDFLRSQNIPGIIVRRRSDGSLCIGSAQGQVRMLNNPGCVPMLVFVNGARATNTDLALRIPPDAVDRMIVYKPVEAGTLFGLGSGNGVLMIYTKGNR